MLDFIPDWTRLLPFLVAALTLNLTPGADMTYVMARSAGQGRVAGVVSSFGISAGSLVHSILAAIGLSALLASSPILFLAIQYGGAAYLVYLAWKAWRSASQPLAMQQRPRARLLQVFLQGAWINPSRGHVAEQFLFLGLLFNIGGTTVNIIVALLIGWASDLLRQSAGFARFMGRFSAAMLLFLAAYTVYTRRTIPG
jgi:threonine/homoserine/homoserine lactone efflux protein